MVRTKLGASGRVVARDVAAMVLIPLAVLYLDIATVVAWAHSVLLRLRRAWPWWRR